MSTLCMGTTSRSCSLNFPSWTFRVHSWVSGEQQVDLEHPCLGMPDPSTPTPAAWGGGQTQALNYQPGCPVALWSGSQTPSPHRVCRRQGACHLSDSGVCSGHWGWILSDPWPGVYPRCSGKPAHTKRGPPSGMRASSGCLDTQGHQASPRGMSPQTLWEKGAMPPGLTLQTI